MTSETQTTISVALSQMYDKGIDHAIETVRESMFEDGQNVASLVNDVLKQIVAKLQNLKTKG